MGGMFTVMKIRDGLARDDYSDPGPYKYPSGTVAYEIETPPSDAPRHLDNKTKGKPAESKDMKGMNMKGMKGM